MFKNKKISILVSILVILNFAAVFVFGSRADDVVADNLSQDEQESTIRSIKTVEPAVVSIIVYDYEQIVNLHLVPGKAVIEKDRKKVSTGTGFIITPDGMILTNKHLLNGTKDDSAEYRVILNSGKQYFAQLIGRDPLNDLAILKIFDKNLPYVKLGDSDKLELGSTVIAIGNSLGRYQNSATKGIVSGLGRSLTAGDKAGFVELLDNIIQTDAQINRGNSGGPLIDLNGNVVGINSAVDEAGMAIGFAIPINDAKPVINSIKEKGIIVRPRIGVRYIMLTPEIALDKNLTRENGALIIKGENGESAITPDSPAEKAGLMENDIIIEINAIKIDGKNKLLSTVQKYKPGQKIGLKVQRGEKIIIIFVTLDEFR